MNTGIVSPLSASWKSIIRIVKNIVLILPLFTGKFGNIVNNENLNI